ncbi:bifunctional hydroxymethylpyrimidine kinase/phosphomethylpyrimidine kinase [Arsenicicoccus sp. oral taxon 190]|uniref:bifunctional hydroxymethylpyrimidine kinase/phosphomethylpyrimidine kinase n=1 Tax=Arsenicicoccus sp. oral taxon 190 TaxID=1658671 RepID=UPI00067A337A|nr:bifunctional hydroxymethylpyrimidine kinase/phosphomethylpyrimidine kinase [Arsenicicoccus sp. oral taxon 190]AKT50375.1 hydroxymethylpyrimidine kinase [Arsenicicoccus sp. oral taxon 190]
MTAAAGPPPKALSIAGSDPSGGAGIQADLKTFSALGTYGMCVLTALTAQSTQGVTGVHAVPADFVTQQLDTLLADITPDAVKIGMLADAEVTGAVRAAVERLRAEERKELPIVLDPVMVATSGDRLLTEDAVGAVRELVPLASIVTPNLPEAALLLGTAQATTPGEMLEQARRLVEQGARRVYLKGGHLDEPDRATDVYADAETTVAGWSERIDTRSTHGTGCTLSSALAALRPQRETWTETVQDAKRWLTEALRHADELQVGHGHGPVHHFHETWSRP